MSEEKMKSIVYNPNSTAEQIRGAHNKWLDTLPEEFQIWRMGKTPLEAMKEGMGVENE